MTTLEACARFIELLTEGDDPRRSSAANLERSAAAMSRVRAKFGAK
jgi:hypothetical protein